MDKRYFSRWMKSQAMNDIEVWLKQCQKELVPCLQVKHFLNSHKILKEFNHWIELWREDNKHLRQLIEKANELFAARSILNNMNINDVLEYEPKLKNKNTKKKIDFLITTPDGHLKWIEVKTIHPDWNDDQYNWDRITKMIEKMPTRCSLMLDRNFSGAALGGITINCRWAFIQRALELEERVNLLTSDEQGEICLLLCSLGSWEQSDLEDFADFYLTKQFRDDDYMQNAIAHRMRDENISFSYTINNFCYLERHHLETLKKFEMNVRGPTIP